MDKRKQRLRVKHALDNAGLSFAEIARRLGRTQPHVMRVAAGERDSQRVWAAIIEALGFDPRTERQSTETAA